MVHLQHGCATWTGNIVESSVLGLLRQAITSAKHQGPWASCYKFFSGQRSLFCHNSKIFHRGHIISIKNQCGRFVHDKYPFPERVITLQNPFWVTLCCYIFNMWSLFDALWQVCLCLTMIVGNVWSWFKGVWLTFEYWVLSWKYRVRVKNFEFELKSSS